MIFTDRLKLVPLEEKHLDSLIRLRNDPTTWHWLTKIDPINSTTQKIWIEKLQKDTSKMYLAIENEEITPVQMGIGDTKTDFVGILRSDEWDRTNRSVRVGIDIMPDFRGKGYATEAFSAFIDYLFKQQNIHRIWLLVSEKNADARKLYEKLGFQLEGIQRDALFRDGKYHGYLMMGLLEDEWILRLRSGQVKK